MKILLVSDIHGNWPALRAVDNCFGDDFDLVINGGDTTVYAPFPNETIAWLREKKAVSILGNTDRIVTGLLGGTTFKKPSNPDKRIMYGWTAAELTGENREWLLSLQNSARVDCPAGSNGETISIGIYHGSPADPDEFLFASTPDGRFGELAASVDHAVVTIGHSHSPFHKVISGVHFINPGSTGRMFDGNPAAGCAVITIHAMTIDVQLHRIAYPVAETINELERLRMPPIYQEMYRLGRKLN